MFASYQAQMILLAAEQHLTAPAIAEIVRADEETVGTWLKRYMAEGINGLADKPRSGSPSKVTAVYRELLLKTVRQRPRSWISRTPSGRCSAWPTIWPSRPASGSALRPCGSA